MEAANEFEVDGRLLTDVGGTLTASVLSTPAMIAMMERTAAMLVWPALGPGKATVGFEVCVKHVAGGPRGDLLHRQSQARARSSMGASSVSRWRSWTGMVEPSGWARTSGGWSIPEGVK